MVVRCRPQEPHFETGSEREVWERVRAQLPADCVLLSNLRLTDAKKDYEADLVVLAPGFGIIVIEVKGGSVKVDDEGRWWVRRAGREVPSDPVGQARDLKYALRAHVERDPRWRESSRSRVRWAHAVVCPYTDLDPGFTLLACPRWMVSGRGDLDHLADRLLAVPAQQETANRVLDADDVELVLEILQGRMRPDHDKLAESDELADRADRLTLEQAALLGATRLLTRVEVRGGAGSGKTVLAVTQAKDLTRGRDGRAPQRTALLCYSLGLSQYLKRCMEGVPRRHRPAFVGSFEELAASWGLTDVPGRDGTSDFWEHELPARMEELARALPEAQRFDAVVVDEAQDFADLWWRPVMAALRDEEVGGLYVYSDENQRIFPRYGRPPVPLVPLVLDHNLRNTRQIAQAFSPLAPMRMRLRGGDGDEVQFVASDRDGALDAADEQVELLLEQWRPRDVALLTTGSRHPVQGERQESLGQVGYWRLFWEDDDVFYGHVLGCKGLERRVVVLCVNSGADTERLREKLYVGMSRATDQLVVVGDPAVVRAVGGDEVARRLGIATR
ncbi:NERD domain-containing protein [Dermatophilaceae bacterium Soc4.6]